jgi:isochorismate synthase/2-succinyl-5-enolpyruvyl-6-hydroxy-3-cyclohexene-1-carboxylate synthase/2-succinyl-6-hydroxy-2,4-cyclohexadiene-1-carboxylate synthase/O-succinylbenzoate synthase
MNNLHPTPAICGFPAKASLEFIQSFESNSFDRGLYAGPIGYLGRDSVDILVAIRSSLLSRAQNLLAQSDGVTDMTMSVYAGAGIVEGSTPQAEWSETSYKLEVLSSLFSQSPFSLQSALNPNVAWASSFVEELIRCGVTQWYICPGSRSTPLTAAVAKALRIHVGIIQAISVHDERAAAFRALGYGRATNRPAVVITSSGTAVANLYPAIMEAGIDGIPLLILTADRPYENRDNGSNQSVDQVKVRISYFIVVMNDQAEQLKI